MPDSHAHSLDHRVPPALPAGRPSREALLPALVAHARLRTALPDGLRFTFPATAERLRQLHALVTSAPACCPSIELRPALAAGGAALTLDVTGPEGATAFLARLLEERTVTA